VKHANTIAIEITIITTSIQDWKGTVEFSLDSDPHFV
jgi:hypothetical protein